MPSGVRPMNFSTFGMKLDFFAPEKLCAVLFGTARIIMKRHAVRR